LQLEEKLELYFKTLESKEDQDDNEDEEYIEMVEKAQKTAKVTNEINPTCLLRVTPINPHKGKNLF
jgi:hypothetical protein